jgi:hypothetical protein
LTPADRIRLDHRRFIRAACGALLAVITAEFGDAVLPQPLQNLSPVLTRFLQPAQNEAIPSSKGRSIRMLRNVERRTCSARKLARNILSVCLAVNVQVRSFAAYPAF